jgi:hypothetical protein
MNGVLHSEHVISRSGIAVLLESEIEDLALYALRSAGVTFLSATGLWHESAVSNARRKACVPTVNWAECTPVVHFFLRISTYANEQKCGE